MAPYQQEILSDLEGGYGEQATSWLYQWWTYDTDALIRRGSAHGQPAKPRIELTVALNRRDNLTVEWRPAVHRPGSSDWLTWHRLEGVGGSRPSNELLYIRDVGTAGVALRNNRLTTRERYDRLPEYFHRKPDTLQQIKEDAREYRREGLAIDATLLQATGRLVQQLRRRLEFSFAVNMVSDIFMEWQEVPGLDTQRLVSWEIERLDERHRRLGLAELQTFEDTMGFSLTEFVAAVAAADARKAKGPAPAPNTKDDRISKSLKKAGRKITVSAVRHFRELVERYRPDLLPLRTAEVIPLGNSSGEPR